MKTMKAMILLKQKPRIPPGGRVQDMAHLIALA